MSTLHFFGLRESHCAKQLKMNVIILMQNQNSPQSLTEQNASTTNITQIHLARNRYMSNK